MKSKSKPTAEETNQASAQASNQVAEPVFAFVPEVVEARLKTWLPKLNPTTIKKLVEFQGEILKFNKTINLISGSTAKNAEAVHIADCVLAAEVMEKSLPPGSDPIYDFGSGNGCPGIVLGILWPGRKLILVDRDQRKMEFCKNAISKLGLANVQVMIQGVEELPVGSVKVAVARGFAPLQRGLLVCRKTMAKDGKFFHMKGDGWAAELAALPSQIFTHWAPGLLGQYRIPESSVDMAVVVTEKTSD